jgi:hypothetical protein
MSFEAEHVRYGAKRIGQVETQANATVISERASLYEAESKERHGCMYVTLFRIDYNLTLCPLQNRFHHIYYEQPYARVHLSP